MSSTIFLIGFMGSGKSFLGKQLAQYLEIEFFDLDDKFIQDKKLSINDFFEKFGEEKFRIEESILLKKVDITKKQVVSTGGGAPCFFDNMDWMNQNGKTIFLEASIDLLAHRLEKEKEHRPLLKELSPTQLHDFIAKRVEHRLPYYSKAQFCISFNQASEDNVLQKLIEIALK